MYRHHVRNIQHVGINGEFIMQMESNITTKKMNRTNKLLLCFKLSFILFSCKDENNSDTILRLNDAELKQTSEKTSI